MKNKVFIAATLLLSIVMTGNLWAQSSNSVSREYIQSLLDYAGIKTVEGKTLVYYRTGFENITLVVCTINPGNSTQCNVTIYEGFPDKSMYEFYKNSKNAFSDDERKTMTFVDKAQCYYRISENESLAMRQNLSKSSGAVIVK